MTAQIKLPYGSLTMTDDDLAHVASLCDQGVTPFYIDADAKAWQDRRGPGSLWEREAERGATKERTRVERIREQLVRVGDEKIAKHCQAIRDAYLSGEPLDGLLATMELLIVARGVVAKGGAL